MLFFLNFRTLTDHQRLLQSAKWFQKSYSDADYIKGTGNYNKFRRGRLDGYLVIHNITYAEAATEYPERITKSRCGAAIGHFLHRYTPAVRCTLRVLSAALQKPNEGH